MNDDTFRVLALAPIMMTNFIIIISMMYEMYKKDGRLFKRREFDDTQPTDIWRCP